jgi:hypothetical protein
MMKRIAIRHYSPLLLIALIGISRHESADALSIVDWFYGYDSNSTNTKASNLTTLSDLSQLRVRDLRRRLTRQHGYGADEISKMIDKKDLIHTLLYEEHKVYQKSEERRKRTMYRRQIISALVCVVVVMFKDLWVQLYEVISVNVVVYTDKKLYEISRCREFKSLKGLMGISLMMVFDVLQAWLTLSVFLSWFMTSSYFFPIPSISIKPAQLLATMAGSSNAAGPLANYGINIGPMIITWLFRFGYGRIESWTGKKLSESYSKRRREEKMAAKTKREESYNDELFMKQREARRAAKEERRKIKEMYRNQSQEGEEQDIQTGKEQDIPIGQDIHENKEMEKTDDTHTHEGMNELD